MQHTLLSIVQGLTENRLPGTCIAELGLSLAPCLERIILVHGIQHTIGGGHSSLAINRCLQ